MFNKIRKALKSFFVDSSKVNRINTNLPVSFQPEIDPLAYLAMLEPSISLGQIVRR